MPLYKEKFPAGTQVRIASLAELEAFQRNWKYHHKLNSDQLFFADRIAMVQKVGFYHGGDVLYELRGIPGIWHEVCLSSVD